LLHSPVATMLFSRRVLCAIHKNDNVETKTWLGA
jgi:hypothetical protein